MKIEFRDATGTMFYPGWLVRRWIIVCWVLSLIVCAVSSSMCYRRGFDDARKFPAGSGIGAECRLVISNVSADAEVEK